MVFERRWEAARIDHGTEVKVGFNARGLLLVLDMVEKSRAVD